MDDNNRDLYISEIITHYLQSHYPTQYGDNAIVDNYKEFLELSKAKSELKDKFNRESLSRLEALNEYFYGNSDGSYSGTGNDLGRQYVTTINTIKSILKSNEDAAKDIASGISSIIETSSLKNGDQATTARFVSEVLIPGLLNNNILTADTSGFKITKPETVTASEALTDTEKKQYSKEETTREDDIKKALKDQADKIAKENEATRKKEEEAAKSKDQGINKKDEKTNENYKKDITNYFDKLKNCYNSTIELIKDDIYKQAIEEFSTTIFTENNDESDIKKDQAIKELNDEIKTLDENLTKTKKLNDENTKALTKITESLDNLDKEITDLKKIEESEQGRDIDKDETKGIENLRIIVKKIIDNNNNITKKTKQELLEKYEKQKEDEEKTKSKLNYTKIEYENTIKKSREELISKKTDLKKYTTTTSIAIFKEILGENKIKSDLEASLSEKSSNTINQVIIFSKLYKLEKTIDIDKLDLIERIQQQINLSDIKDRIKKFKLDCDEFLKLCNKFKDDHRKIKKELSDAEQIYKTNKKKQQNIIETSYGLCYSLFTDNFNEDVKACLAKHSPEPEFDKYIPDISLTFGSKYIVSSDKSFKNVINDSYKLDKCKYTNLFLDIFLLSKYLKDNPNDNEKYQLFQKKTKLFLQIHNTNIAPLSISSSTSAAIINSDDQNDSIVKNKSGKIELQDALMVTLAHDIAIGMPQKQSNIKGIYLIPENTGSKDRLNIMNQKVKLIYKNINEISININGIFSSFSKFNLYTFKEYIGSLEQQKNEIIAALAQYKQGPEIISKDIENILSNIITYITLLIQYKHQFLIVNTSDVTTIKDLIQKLNTDLKNLNTHLLKITTGGALVVEESIIGAEKAMVQSLIKGQQAINITIDNTYHKTTYYDMYYIETLVTNLDTFKTNIGKLQHFITFVFNKITTQIDFFDGLYCILYLKHNIKLIYISLEQIFKSLITITESHKNYIYKLLYANIILLFLLNKQATGH